jgi:hypothetical protein
MRFIEMFFGLSPDANTGTTEATILLALVVAAISPLLLRHHRKRNKQA